MKVLTTAQAIIVFGVRKDEEWIIRLVRYMSFSKNRSIKCECV